MTPTETVREFVAAINSQHLDKMVGLMTPDHRFTDSLGNEIQGRMAMRDAWIAYFKMNPDYTVTVRETFSSDDLVMVVGSAGATYSAGGDPLPEDRWTVPAAWRAVVKDGRIVAWQAFVDNEPLRRVMRRHGIEI